MFTTVMIRIRMPSFGLSVCLCHNFLLVYSRPFYFDCKYMKSKVFISVKK